MLVDILVVVLGAVLFGGYLALGRFVMGFLDGAIGYVSDEEPEAIDWMLALLWPIILFGCVFMYWFPALVVRIASWLWRPFKGHSVNMYVKGAQLSRRYRSRNRTSDRG